MTYFTLAKRFELEILIVEKLGKAWTLYMQPYRWWFDSSKPNLHMLNGMSIEIISKEQGMKILTRHTNGINGTKVKKLINEIKEEEP